MDSLESIHGLAISLIQIGSYSTLTRTSPSMEGSIINRFPSMGWTEELGGSGPHRRVQRGLTKWSAGMSHPSFETSVSLRLPNLARTVTDAHHLVKRRLVSTSPESTATDSMIVASISLGHKILLPRTPTVPSGTTTQVGTIPSRRASRTSAWPAWMLSSIHSSGPGR